MAHHLAELMTEAESGSSVSARSKARREATDTIIKIWESRASVPGGIFPLAKYREVLKGIQRLQPGREISTYFELIYGEEQDLLAAGLIDGFQRLIISLLLMKMDPADRLQDIDSTVLDALTDTEYQLLTTFQEWEKVVQPLPKKSPRRRRASKGAHLAADKPEELAAKLVDDLTITLARLRGLLQEDDVTGKKVKS